MSVYVLNYNAICWQPHPIHIPPSLPPPAKEDADLLVCLWPLPSDTRGAGGTPLSVLSFCLWIKQLPLSLFSHGSRRSVHASGALAKALQPVCAAHHMAQWPVITCLSVGVSALQPLSVLPVPACVCV